MKREREGMSALPSHWVMIRLGAMGDVALTTGVLDYWHREHGLRFTVITKSGLEPLFMGHPAVKKVVGLKKDDLQGSGLWRAWWRLAKEYKGDGLLDLHGTLRSRLLGLLWRGPVRRYSKLAAERRVFLATGARFFGERLLEWNVPQRYALALPELCGEKAPERVALRPKIFLQDAERQWAEEMLTEMGLNGKHPVALHPYATHMNKVWGLEKWRALANRLDERGVPWIVLGQSLDRIMGGEEKRDLTGRTSLRETCALLACCRVLVTGDSGPMHLAAGVDTPVVALFGPTTAHWGFFPAGKDDRVLEQPLPCRPCSLHGSTPCRKGLVCLASIDVERVVPLVEAR